MKASLELHRQTFVVAVVVSLAIGVFVGLCKMARNELEFIFYLKKNQMFNGNAKQQKQIFTYRLLGHQSHLAFAVPRYSMIRLRVWSVFVAWRMFLG